MSKQTVLPPTPSPSPPPHSPALRADNPLNPAQIHGESPKLDFTTFCHVPSLLDFRDDHGTATPFAQSSEQSPARPRRHSFHFTPPSSSSLNLAGSPTTPPLPLPDILTDDQINFQLFSSENARVEVERDHGGAAKESVQGSSRVAESTIISHEHRIAGELVPFESGEAPVFRFGRVKFFNSQKGFGFIVDSNPHDLADDEVFVHYSAIAAVQPGNGTFRCLSEGEEVRYHVVRGGKGFSAANVTAPDGGPCLGSAFVNSPYAHLSQSPPTSTSPPSASEKPVTIAGRRGNSFQRDRKTTHFSTVRLSNAYGDASYPAVDHERGLHQGINPHHSHSYSMGYQDYAGMLHSPYGGPGPIFWRGASGDTSGSAGNPSSPLLYSPISPPSPYSFPYFPMQQSLPPVTLSSTRPPLISHHRRHPSSASTARTEDLSTLANLEMPTTSTDSKGEGNLVRVENAAESSVGVAGVKVAEHESVSRVEEESLGENESSKAGTDSPQEYHAPPTPGGLDAHRFWSQRSSPSFSNVPLGTPSFPGFYQNAQYFQHGDNGSLPLSQLYSPSFPVAPHYHSNNYVHPGYSPAISIDRNGSLAPPTRRGSVNYFGQVHT